MGCDPHWDEAVWCSRVGSVDSIQVAGDRGMFTGAMELALTAAKREDFQRLARATSTPAGIARRARCILLLAEGRSYSAIGDVLGARERFIAWWKRRYVEGGCSRCSMRRVRAGRTIGSRPPRTPGFFT